MNAAALWCDGAKDAIRPIPVVAYGHNLARADLRLSNVCVLSITLAALGQRCNALDVQSPRDNRYSGYVYPSPLLLSLQRSRKEAAGQGRGSCLRSPPVNGTSFCLAYTESSIDHW
jgi:hypothetical protein